MLYKKKEQDKMYWQKNKSKITFWFKTKFEKMLDFANKDTEQESGLKIN
jgi:hypothetical protein